MYNRPDIEKWEDMTMNCMKCGRETAEDQVFCELCLNEMENYPVKPGTVVLIPSRNEEDEVRRIQHRKRPALSVSDQIVRLRKKLLWTRIALALLLVACGLLCMAVGRLAVEWDAERDLGQNYSTVDASGNVTTP